MIALFLSPIYILLNIYIFFRWTRWMGACHHIFKHKWAFTSLIILYTVLATSLLTGFLLPPSLLKRILKLTGNYWLGTLLYTLLTLFVADLTRLLLKRLQFKHKNKLFSRAGFISVGALCILIIISLSVTGILSAHKLHTTEYAVSVKKDCGSRKELNIVLLADLHLGYNTGIQYIQKMVQTVNAQKPDIVVIAGDIFDNEFEALFKPDKIASALSGIKSKYGVYACYGNHDIQEKILAGFTFSGSQHKQSDQRMDDFLQQANIKLLMDKGTLIDDAFYLYGRPDYERPGRGILKRKTPSEITEAMDKSKPIIVIDHQPRELKELADAGVDLDLCGHTHDGQMFPANLTVRLLWENACGYLKKGEMHNIVTSGIGVFGPNMRVGTKSELCKIKVTFTR